MIFQFLLLVFLCSNIKTENVTILTKFGSVTGNRTISQNGFQYDIFSGIPFAKKAERFKKSELITSWDGILMATQNAKKCIPKTRPQNSDDFSEDCLFLNIMRPSKRNISMKMPVVVFIHGGGFAEGDANVANCNEFAKSFSSQMIVVVSIQYRLGAFGFLSLGCNSTILPCNIGIWDQKTAFEFVDKIIEDFGGDNRKMTLMGHSAGAMSVSIHSISPITSKYFNNFIELSGSYWGLLANQNSKNQKKVLEQIGCNFSNFSIIFECLSSVNLNDLYEAQKNTELYPDIGDELLPDYPFNLVKKEKTKKNLLSGLQTLELLYGSPYNGNFDYDPLVTKNELLNYINSSLSSKYGKNQHQAFSMISDHFIFKNPDFDDNDDRFYFQQRSRIDSNLAVDISVLREIQDKLPFYGSIYVYHFKHFNNNEFDKNYPIKSFFFTGKQFDFSFQHFFCSASYHCEEFPYLWNVFLHEKFVFNENDTKVSAFFVKSLGNFIKFGNPSTDKIDWPSTDSSFIHLEITSEPKISRSGNETVILQTEFGYLRGNRTKTENGFQYDIFTGIPFAQKPKRLQKSILVEKTTGIINATNFPPKCIPKLRPKDSDFSENCLFLNIITPSNRTKFDKFPVVVHLHGGKFEKGDGNTAKCDSFAKNIVSQGIIVVVIQYRLAAFGFLSLGCDSTIFPCNIGIWDQITAFEYLNKTIQSFGGDNQKMTLMGHSAGSTCVSIHSVSPISSKYFKHFVQLSGTSWLLSSFVNKTRIESKKILEKLGCDYSNKKTFFKCFENLTLNDLYDVQTDMKYYPDIGDQILPDYAFNLAHQSINQSLLTGLQTIEFLYSGALKPIPIVNRETVTNYIKSITFEYQNQSENAAKMISEYYLGKNQFDQNSAFYFQQISKIESNIAFDVGVMREILDKLKYSKQIFFYHWEYLNENQFFPDFPLKVTHHAQEFPYIWNVFFDRKFVFTENDKKVARFFVEALGNFIKTGNPSTSTFLWPPTDKTFTHVKIHPTPFVSKHLFHDAFEFWESLKLKTKYDLLTLLPSNSSVSYYKYLLDILISYFLIFSFY